ncbi:phosphoglucomutase/phosphomannomutase family protein, partial [bacterium]|nr:phosphoglucomutase/phosphomannomutase family protein [bacterium]
MNTIQFGTSGYRGLLGSSFAISHVEVIVNAISVWLIGQRVQKIIIGYDPRTGNRLTDDPSFSRRAAEILSGAGIDVVLSSVPVPTPLISWYCRVNQCAGINFT